MCDTFNKFFEKFPTIQFNPEWNNGTGYLNGAVCDSSITQPASFTTNDGRRGFVFPDVFGDNIVIFERYSNASGITYNGSTRSEAILNAGAGEYVGRLQDHHIRCFLNLSAIPVM